MIKPDSTLCHFYSRVTFFTLQRSNVDDFDLRKNQTASLKIIIKWSNNTQHISARPRIDWNWFSLHDNTMIDCLVLCQFISACLLSPFYTRQTNTLMENRKFVTNLNNEADKHRLTKLAPRPVHSIDVARLNYAFGSECEPSKTLFHHELDVYLLHNDVQLLTLSERRGSFFQQWTCFKLYFSRTH